MSTIEKLLSRLSIQPGTPGVWRGFLDPAAIIQLCEAGAQPERPRAEACARLDLAAGRHQATWVYWHLSDELKKAWEALPAPSPVFDSQGILGRARLGRSG